MVESDFTTVKWIVDVDFKQYYHMSISRVNIRVEYLNVTTNWKLISIQLMGYTLIWHSSWDLVGITNSVNNLFKNLVERECIFSAYWLKATKTIVIWSQTLCELL